MYAGPRSLLGIRVARRENMYRMETHHVELDTRLDCERIALDWIELLKFNPLASDD
jgi:hypothetical protein